MAGLSLSLTVILVFSCHLVNSAPSLIPPAGTLVDNQVRKNIEHRIEFTCSKPDR